MNALSLEVISKIWNNPKCSWEIRERYNPPQGLSSQEVAEYFLQEKPIEAKELLVDFCLGRYADPKLWTHESPLELARKLDIDKAALLNRIQCFDIREILGATETMGSREDAYILAPKGENSFEFCYSERGIKFTQKIYPTESAITEAFLSGEIRPVKGPDGEDT